jgi:hypothetical protein
MFRSPTHAINGQIRRLCCSIVPGRVMPLLPLPQCFAQRLYFTRSVIEQFQVWRWLKWASDEKPTIAHHKHATDHIFTKTRWYHRAICEYLWPIFAATTHLSRVCSVCDFQWYRIITHILLSVGCTSSGSVDWNSPVIWRVIFMDNGAFSYKVCTLNVRFSTHIFAAMLVQG